MKRLLVGIFLLSAPLLSAAAAEEPRSVQVNGEGVVKVEPDQVKLQFGIESNDRVLVKAKDDNTARTKKLLDTLKALGVASKDIQTGFVQINPRYEYANNRQVLVGYTAMKQLSVTLKDLQNYGKVLNGVIEAGADHVNGVQFESSKADELKDEARKRAVADAKRKAQLLAGELNQKVGVPLSIQESEAPVYQPVFRGAMAMKAMDASPEDTLSPGEITVRSAVTVRFQLQ
jgi:uncharacterized protein YggE